MAVVAGYEAMADEAHWVGEVWCSALWEVRVNLITKHGFTTGNQLTLQLVTDGMNLGPANPNFLQGRDAILLADRVLTGGQNQPEIWAGFAKRGLGYSATTPPDSNIITGIGAAYDMPTALEAWNYFTGGGILSSPAVKESNGQVERIYVGSSDGKVHAINPNNTVQWTFPASSGIGYAFNSSPAIAPDGTIYIGCDNGWFYALNPDGTEKWKFQTGSAIFSSPAIGSDGSVYFGSGDGKIYARTSAGASKWSVTTGDMVMSSPAISSDGWVYVGSFDNKVYALSASSGSAKSGSWPFVTGDDVVSSPAIGSDGTIYVGSVDNKMYAINPNGTQKWSYSTGGDIRSSPALATDGTVYFGSDDGKVYALYGSGPTKKWDSNVGTVKSSPAVTSTGMIIASTYASGGQVLWLDPANGSPVADYSATDYIFSSPAIATDGKIYIATAVSGKVVCLVNFSALAPSAWPMFRKNLKHTGL